MSPRPAGGPGRRSGRAPKDRQPPGAFTAEAGAALAALGDRGADPILVAYHPVARVNPFQALLYGEAASAGLAVVPLVHVEAIDELAAIAGSGVETVLHLHWLGSVMGAATTEAEAAAAVTAFLARIDRYLAAGGRLAWTVHNILPHGSRFEDRDAALRQAVADRAALVHVMAPRTAELVAPWFRLRPATLLHVPHPAYTGVYPHDTGRDEARRALGLASDELVVLAFGAIRAYKGIALLLDAWDAVPGDGPRRLLIAGEPSADPGTAAVLERAAARPTVTIHPRRVPARDVQHYFAAADVAVLPYTRSLNSGALMLAMTFGCPVVVPATSSLADVVDARCAITFDPADPRSLAGAVADARRLADPAAREAATAIARAHDPAELSRRFAGGLRAACRRGGGA